MTMNCVSFGWMSNNPSTRLHLCGTDAGLKKVEEFFMIALETVHWLDLYYLTETYLNYLKKKDNLWEGPWAILW